MIKGIIILTLFASVCSHAGGCGEGLTPFSGETIEDQIRNLGLENVEATETEIIAVTTTINKLQSIKFIKFPQARLEVVVTHPTLGMGLEGHGMTWGPRIRQTGNVTFDLYFTTNLDTINQILKYLKTVDLLSTSFR